MTATIGIRNGPKPRILSTTSMCHLLRKFRTTCNARPATFFGGADRDRTGGLLVANQALSQLSYSPKPSFVLGRSSLAKSQRPTTNDPRPTTDFWWAWIDLNYRPHPYQGCALAT